MREGVIQNRHSPPAVENFFRRVIGRRFAQVPALGLRLVERQEGFPAAAFGCLAAVILVDQKAIQCRQQKRAESAPVWSDVRQTVLFEQSHKKMLPEVLPIVWHVA